MEPSHRRTNLRNPPQKPTAMCPIPAHDRRAVSSTLQAVVLVALVTVTVAGLGYAVLGLILVDDAPEVKQVKLHVSETGITVTPMIADPLPADKVEVSIDRESREPMGLTVLNVAGASMAADPAQFLESDAAGRGAVPPPITAVESAFGPDADSPATAIWAAGEPLHVETSAGYIQQNDVLSVQVIDRQHRNLLLEKHLRAAELPRTLILDVDPSPGGGGDAVPPDDSDDPSGADRSDSGGVLTLGNQWDRAERSLAPRAHNPVVARAQPGAGNGPGGSRTSDAGGGFDVDPEISIPNDFPTSGSGDSASELAFDNLVAESGSQSSGSVDPGMTGDTIADTIDASQSRGIAVTNGDGGAVMMDNGRGETITVIDGETWSQANAGHSTGTVLLSEFDQGIQNRVEAGLQGHNNARAETICSCASPDSTGGSGEATSVSGSGQGSMAGDGSDPGDASAGGTTLSTNSDPIDVSSIGGNVADSIDAPDIGSVSAPSGGDVGGSVDVGPDVGATSPDVDIDVGGIDVSVSSIDIGGISI